MIEKVENPLDLTLEQVEVYIAELQQSFDRHHGNLPLWLTLNETGCMITLYTETEEATYSLEQLKKIKAEMLNPLVMSASEVA